MESYTFLVDSRLSYPYGLISKHALFASENVGDITAFVYQYMNQGDLDNVKKDFDEIFSGHYKFDMKYHNDSGYVDATMYTTSIVQTFSTQYDEVIKFLTENVWPVAEPILKKEYDKGNLKLPVYFFFGESSSCPSQKIERYELDFLALQRYAFGDFTGHWKDYALYNEDVFLVKYGAYEKAVSVNVSNSFDNVRSVKNIRGLEQSFPNLTNWVWTDPKTRTRIVGFNHSSVDHSSELVQLLTKKEFWVKFVLPQFLDEDVTGKYEPIINKTFLVSKFVKKLLETERTEVANMEASIISNRQSIELSIHEITLIKLLLAKQEAEIVAKKKSMTSETKLRTSLASQMATLMSHPYIENIEIGEKFVIKTTPINIDGVVPVGGYYITLTMGQNPNITIVNDENPKEGFDHPHVPRGRPCWGNYTDIFVHLANTDLISTMEIMFRFLESWNPSDCYGKNLIWWDAKYAFDTLKEMNLMHTLERVWRDIYRSEFGEDIEGSTCPSCGEEPDYCDCYCPRCGAHRDNECECERCGYCGSLWEEGYRDCGCERCEHCEQHLEDCECSFCSFCDENEDAGYCDCDHCPACGENINAGDCGCERCEECAELIEDCGCDRCATCFELVGECNCSDEIIINVREGQIQMETV